MKICLLIRSLNFGGAQSQMIVLANALALRGHIVMLVVFYPNGQLEKSLSKQVRLISLNKKGRWDLLGFFFRFYQILKINKPNVIYSFLEESNLTSVVFKIFFPQIDIIWGMRHSFLKLEQYGWATSLGETLTNFCSRFPDKIIFNSYTGKKLSLIKGYPESKVLVIPNGIDVKKYYKDNSIRNKLRNDLKIKDKSKLIGIVGRLDPMKDHKTFLLAADTLNKKYENLNFMCVGYGDGNEKYKEKLNFFISELNLSKNLILLGNRLDMLAIYNALDILVSSSIGEGFSNVIGEAMACGTPCVATDVGDSSLIINDKNLIIPPSNPKKLANTLEWCLKNYYTFDPLKIRNSITQRFSIERMVDGTEKSFINNI